MPIKRQQHRLDFVDAQLAAPKVLPNGWLELSGVFTRSGVLSYTNPDGSSRLEYRPPSEVFASSHLDSMIAVPVVIQHPSKMLDSNDTKDHQVGSVKTAKRLGVYVAGSLIITDAGAIKALQEGWAGSQLSLGYTCDVDDRPGTTPEGKHYHKTQFNIFVNHLALVDKARAGEECALRLDSAIVSEQTINKTEQVKTMQKIMMDGVEYEVTEEVAAAYNKMIAQQTTARADSAADLRGEMRARLNLEAIAQKHARLDAKDAQRLSVPELLMKTLRSLGFRQDALNGQSQAFLVGALQGALSTLAQRNEALDDTVRAIGVMQFGGALAGAPREDRDPERAATMRNKEWLKNRHKEAFRKDNGDPQPQAPAKPTLSLVPPQSEDRVDGEVSIAGLNWYASRAPALHIDEAEREDARSESEEDAAMRRHRIYLKNRYKGEDAANALANGSLSDQSKRAHDEDKALRAMEAERVRNLPDAFEGEL